MKYRTVVHKDDIGIYVIAGGYKARPGDVCGYDHAYIMGSAGLKPNDHVKSRHIAGSPLIKIVTTHGAVLHWHTEARKCLVMGCLNYSDGGQFLGELCMPCHEMLATGEVHHNNPTFIGDMKRKLLGQKGPTHA